MKVVSVVILVICIAAGASAQPADPVIARAEVMLRGDQAEQAVALLEKGIEAAPGNAARHYWLGRACGELARDKSMFRMISLARKAAAAFERAVQLDPGFIDARYALVEFNLMAPGILGGSAAEARVQAQEIRKRDALAGHRAFAAIAVSEKDHARARAEHLAAVKAGPASPEPRYWFGVFLMLTTKEYRAAAEQFAEALRVDPSFMPAHFQLGHVAALSGMDLPGGAQSLQRYLRHQPAGDDPSLYRAHYWLGVIYEKQGRRAEARQQFHAALRLRPSDEEVRGPATGVVKTH